MLSKEIQVFSEIRYEVRAYMCYLLQRHIKNHLPYVELNKIVEALERIKGNMQFFELFYVLDSHGTQVIDGISRNTNLISKKGLNFNDRAYFYRAVQEQKCVLTDPYPSRVSNNLVVTAAYPVYDIKNNLRYVVCIDLPLSNALLLVNPSPLFNFSSHFTKFVYFVLSLMLLVVCIALLVKGGSSMYTSSLHLGSLDIKEIFEATILLTLSLAIFDLVRAIFEEEVLGRSRSQDSKVVHKTMIRFLGSIIIALAIEALMLVFKFTIIEPDKIIYAVYLIGGVTMLLLGLSVYVFLTTRRGNPYDRDY